MPERKIYIVKSSSGQYEDSCVSNERAFTSRQAAEAYAKKLDWEHLPDPVFSDEQWKAAQQAWHELNFEKYGEDYEIGPYDWKTEREKYDQWQADYDDRQHHFLLEYLNRETGKTYTLSDILQHERYDDNRYYDWYPCKVEELVLEESGINEFENHEQGELVYNAEYNDYLSHEPGDDDFVDIEEAFEEIHEHVKQIYRENGDL